MKQISAPELAAWLADAGRAKPLLLDVREPWEFETARDLCEQVCVRLMRNNPPNVTAGEVIPLQERLTRGRDSTRCLQNHRLAVHTGREVR